jgi:hypothetical protein
MHTPIPDSDEPYPKEERDRWSYDSPRIILEEPVIQRIIRDIYSMPSYELTLLFGSRARMI